MNLPEVDDLKSLFLNDTPLLDVRAPVEFEQGAFPNAVNHPLIDNDERHRIGIEYKEQGQDMAIELGHELVSGTHREARIDHWQSFAEAHPEGVLYCFRGGMRSKISQQWLHERTGHAFPRVKGGYKAMRRFLIDEMDAHIESIACVSVGGRTGSGKTRFLERFDHAIDLEGLANHRGSAFGSRARQQPAQIDFENALSIALLKHRHAGRRNLVLEDEGRYIGSRHIPLHVSEHFRNSDLLVLDVSAEDRIANTLDEYVLNACDEFQVEYGTEAGFNRWANYLKGSLEKVRKRLGAVRYQSLADTMSEAIDSHREHGDVASHKRWIEPLLLDYYDPMYDYQISKSRERIRFRGNPDEVADYIQQRYPA